MFLLNGKLIYFWSIICDFFFIIFLFVNVKLLVFVYCRFFIWGLVFYFVVMDDVIVYWGSGVFGVELDRYKFIFCY